MSADRRGGRRPPATDDQYVHTRSQAGFIIQEPNITDIHIGALLGFLPRQPDPLDEARTDAILKRLEDKAKD